MGIFERASNARPDTGGGNTDCIAGRNILARAKNGTGKTGAYVIPTLEARLVENAYSSLASPTRELALQTSAVVRELGKHMKINIMISTGVRTCAMTLCACKASSTSWWPPQAILDLAEKNIADLSKCGLVCLDEADKLLSPTFEPIIEKLIRFCSPNRQILLFSATFPKSNHSKTETSKIRTKSI